MSESFPLDSDPFSDPSTESSAPSEPVTEAAASEVQGETVPAEPPFGGVVPDSPVLDQFITGGDAAAQTEPTQVENVPVPFGTADLQQALESVSDSTVILVPRPRVFGDTLEEIAKQKADAEARKAQLQEALDATNQQLNELAELELITEDPEARRAVELGAKLGIALR